MQASSLRWTPPGGILGQLVAEAHERARAAVIAGGSQHERLADQLAAVPPPPSFAAALRAASDAGTVAVVAEVKRRSPSRGAINSTLSARAQALAYAAGGAAAISVLTEPNHFGGSLEDLVEARTAVAIPLLRKDFVVDAAQLLEARLAGASAVLLIARALDPRQLEVLAARAAGLGLEALIEVRTEEELSRAAALGAPMIGVNQRDLETLAMDPEVLRRLLPLVPARCLALAESGTRGRADVTQVATWGADAVLVGSAVSAAADPAGAVRELTGVARGGPRGD